MVGSSGVAALDLLVLRGFLRWLRALVLSRFVGQRLRGMIQRRSTEDLTAVMELIEAGKVTPVISATYPLSDAPEALRHFEEGHGQGRVVIAI
jgi:NADPH:quinone reductase-like Zn-dependent oxidoreductase